MGIIVSILLGLIAAVVIIGFAVTLSKINEKIDQLLKEVHDGITLKEILMADGSLADRIEIKRDADG